MSTTQMDSRRTRDFSSRLRTERARVERSERVRSRSPIRPVASAERKRREESCQKPLPKPSQSEGQNGSAAPLTSALTSAEAAHESRGEAVSRKRKRDSEDSEPEVKRPKHHDKERRQHPSQLFEQGRLLGRGGFGSVYAGIRKSDGLKVAIKYIPKMVSDLIVDSEGHSYPLEVALMAKANGGPPCPNILRLLNWYEKDDDFVLILERPDPCQDLNEFCDDFCGLTEDWSKSIILQLVNALKHCESQGVLHRDVKPENILVSMDTRDIKLFDFGCGDFLRKTAYKEFAGTFDYTPPEWFLRGRYHAGPATVWSVGVTLYAIVCNELPFKTTKETIKNQLVFPSHLSEECKDLISWCLSTKPTDRPTLEDIEHHPWFR